MLGRLRRNQCGVLGLLALGVLLSGVAWAGSGYLQAGDWQYDDLDVLARAGLLAGHPAAPLQTWTDRLTRFEAASLTLRGVDSIGQAYQAQGSQLRELAQAGAAALEGGTTGASSEGSSTPPASAIRSEDLARVQKLIQEFRTELVGMGQKLSDLDSSVQLIMSMTKDIQKQLGEVAADQKKHKIDGYGQFRYQSDHASKGITAGESEFLMRRTRVNLRGPVSEKVSYRVEMQLDSKETGKGPGSKAQLRTLAFDYRFSPETFLRAGQVILPWGYELEESVPTLWTGERALFMDRLFPDQRGIGAFVEYRKWPAAPKLDVGLVNDVGINSLDSNSRQNVLARVDIPIRWGSLALSGYSGRTGAGAAEQAQDRYGVSTRMAWSRLQFLGEWVQGKDLGHDVRGWYAQLGHPVAKSDQHPNLLFAKFDTYDENRDAADDRFSRWCLGYWYDLDKATRLTAVWELRDVDAKFSESGKWTGDAGYLQLQVKF